MVPNTSLIAIHTNNSTCEDMMNTIGEEQYILSCQCSLSNQLYRPPSSRVCYTESIIVSRTLFELTLSSLSL